MQLLKVIEQEWTNTGIIHRFNKCTSNVIFALIYIYDIGYFDIFATFNQVVKLSSVSPDAIVTYNAFTTNFVKGNGTRVNK